jgi:hypothetical protein
MQPILVSVVSLSDMGRSQFSWIMDALKKFV